MVKRIYNQGGLGNQLFIWRAAHLLHLETSQDVEIVCLRNESDSRPNELYQLTKLCTHPIHIREVNKYSFRVRFAQKYPKIYRSVRRLTFKRFQVGIAIEPQAQLNQISMKYSDYLGFFQNKMDGLWDELNLGQEILDNLEVVWKELDRSKSLETRASFQVFHVRRGDYATGERKFGQLSARYFRENMSSNLPVIICTDADVLDPDFLVEFPDAEVLDKSHLAVWPTLALMVKAEQFVGSNSTLSWWAAKLRTLLGLPSVLPRPWFERIPQNPDFEIEGVKFSKSVFL